MIKKTLTGALAALLLTAAAEGMPLDDHEKEAPGFIEALCGLCWNYFKIEVVWEQEGGKPAAFCKSRMHQLYHRDHIYETMIGCREETHNEEATDEDCNQRIDELDHSNWAAFTIGWGKEEKDQHTFYKLKTLTSKNYVHRIRGKRVLYAYPAKGEEQREAMEMTMGPRNPMGRTPKRYIPMGNATFILEAAEEINAANYEGSFCKDLGD